MKFTRLRALLVVVIKHLKSNRLFYLKSLGALSKEHYFEAIIWLIPPTLHISIGAIQTYRSYQKRKQLDEKKRP